MKISKSKLKTRVINNNEYLVYRFMINGKSKSIYGKTLKEIQAKYDKYNQEDNSSSNKIFDYYFNKYLHEKRASWKVQTYTSRANFYNKHLKGSTLAKKKLSKIVKADIRTFIEKLELSNSTKREKLHVLRQFYNWAIESDYCSSNPCNNIHIKVKNNNSELVDTVTVSQILHDVKGKSIEPVIILLCYGARLGEAMAANKNDLDNEGIFIKHSLTKATVEGCTRTFLEPPKTVDSVRKVYLPIEIINTLRNCPGGIDGYYCKTKKGWLSRNRVYNFLSKYNVTPHQLRKYYCTNLLMNNVNIYSVQSQLGHSKGSNATERYYLLNDQDKIKTEINKFFNEEG